MRTHFSHVLGVVYIPASREICKKRLTLECSVFSDFPRTIGKSLSPCFGDNTTDVMTNTNFLFPIPFPLKRLCETLR